MPVKGDRFMWVLVLFDLPTKTKKDRHRATKFRNFLLKDGYMMLQWSNYARLCNGVERVDKHLQRLQLNLPPKGSVRALRITDQQFNRMEILVGEPEKNEPRGKKKTSQQLDLF
jgi:CRISPR-associated protein Cas2